jgi:outer membrane protein
MPVFEDLTPGAPLLTLEEVVRIALTVHPQITAAQANVVATAAKYGMDRATSNLIPNATLSTQLLGNYTYNSAPQGLPPPCSPVLLPALNPTMQPINPLMASSIAGYLSSGCPSASSPTTAFGSYRANLSLTQLIYDFGRTGGQLATDTALTRATGGDRDTARAQVALQAVTAYYAVLAAEALYQVAVQNLTTQNQHLDQTQGFFSIGTRPEIDVLTAKTAAAQAQLQLVQAKNTVRLDRVQLLQAMGLTDHSYLGRPLEPGSQAPLPEEAQPINELVQRALDLRPDYAAARDRVIAAEEQVRVARGGFFPVISLIGTLTGSGSFGSSVNVSGGAVNANLASSGAPFVSLQGGISITWPFDDGGEAYFTLKQNEALVKVARDTMENLRQQMLAGVEQAYITVVNARQNLDAARVVLAQADKQLETANGRYTSGVGTIIELTDAQNQDITARSQLVQAEFSLGVARAGLRMQLGTLIEQNPAHRDDPPPPGGLAPVNSAN